MPLYLVTIDLTGADLPAFEAYEAKVLPLLGRHGGRLELRVRALDGAAETHLLAFPDGEAFERYRSDPDRLALAREREACGAGFGTAEVTSVPS